MEIGVIGAGIIGLTTALKVQETIPNANVTIIADKFTKDTTSHGAAGIFRPGTTFFGPTKEITKNWIRESYNFYDNILQSDQADKAGISQVSGYIFSSIREELTKNDLIEDVVPVYRKATAEELQLCSKSFPYGSYYTTIVTECSYFLPWALEKFRNQGGNVLKHTITNFTDLSYSLPNVSSKFDVVFNCSGMNAKWLCNDDKLVPVRGQVIKVKAPWIKMSIYNDFDTYIVPGKEVVTLGGCRQLNSYSPEVSSLDSQGIWERCTSLVPSLKKSKILEEWVGLRPHRDTVRCELEEIDIGILKKLPVIHNYGHGGYGVTFAPATASYAVEQLTGHLRMNSFERGSIKNSLVHCQRSKL